MGSNDTAIPYACFWGFDKAQILTKFVAAVLTHGSRLIPQKSPLCLSRYLILSQTIKLNISALVTFVKLLK